MYIVRYEQVGFSLAVMMILIHVFLFDRTQKLNRAFYMFAVFTAIECALDMLSAYGINGKWQWPDHVNMFITSAYFIATSVATVYGYGVVVYRLNYINRLANILANFVFAAMILAIVGNLFFKYLFWFDNGIYNSTIFIKLYPLIAVFYLIIVAIAFFKCRKSLKGTEKFGPYAFVLSIVAAIVVQSIMPEYLLVGFGKAISGILFCIFLETPEHIQLKNLVDELEKSQEKKLKCIEQLETENARKTEFLVHMSHELRTPINAVLGFNEILSRVNIDPDLDRVSVKLNRHTTDMMDLVESIADFSQIDVGVLELHQKEYDLAGAYFYLNRALIMLMRESKVEYKQLIFAEDIPKRLYGDVNRIYQVFETIIQCTINDMTRGYMILKLSLDHIEDNVAYVTYYIQFVGDAPKINYEKNVLEDVIVRHILECMDSKLEISYREGIGKTFRFTIPQEIVDLKPLGNVENARLDQALYEEDLEQNFIMPEARVLVVDDTSVNLSVCKGLLKPYRIRFLSANSGREALELMRRSEVDLVLMDILMPEMDGVETMKLIKSDTSVISKNAVFVALTANCFNGARDKYIEDGFDEYMSKPINGNKLANLLKEYLPSMIQEDWAELDVEEPQAEEYDLLDCLNEIPGLNIKEGLSNCIGDVTLYLEAMKEYVSSEFGEKMERFKKAKDWNNYQIIVHAAKSTSKTLGFDDLAELARKLEVSAKNEDLEYIYDNHSNWVQMYHMVKELIQKLHA